MENFKMKKLAVLIFAVLLSSSCAHQHQKEGATLSPSPNQSKGLNQSQTLNQSQSLNQSRREAVKSKALQWIVDHPASFKDGGFLEMGEEANLFYVLYTRAKSAEEKKFSRDRLERIVQELRAQKDFRIQFAGEITAYLAITKAAERLGFETDDFHQFIRRDILNSEMTYPGNITYTILNCALLRDLGYEPKVRMEGSIEEGVIVSMTKNSSLIPIGKSYALDTDVTNFFYDITHEIFAISSFGDKDPERMLMPKEIEFVRSIISEGINRYLPKKELDILCELVVCANIMGYKDVSGLQEILGFICDSQAEDGDFGMIPRMKDLGRGNFYRHGVLVAVWALSS